MIINWDEYFSGVAKLSALRSKDPSTQVGACIVNNKKKIVGVGYNGFPTGCADSIFPWGNQGDRIDTKYPYVVHAEMNAILNSTTSLENGTIYVTLFPCCECAKAIIQTGIKEVVYCRDYKDTESNFASKKMFDAAGVKYRKIDEVEVTLTKKE